MSSSSNFELLMRFAVEKFSFNPENKAGMKIASHDGRSTILIVPARPEEDGFGHRLGVQAGITCSVSCSLDQRAFISKFLDGKLEHRNDAAKPPFWSHRELAVDAEGSLKQGVAFWFDWFPSDIKALVDDATERACADFSRLIRILRWEQNSPFRIPSPSELGAPYWRTSGDGPFCLVPQRSSVIYAKVDREVGSFGWNEAEQLGFSKLWLDPAVDEPLGHELQNEAELLVERAPRSALLMATAAVEAGVKDHVSRIAPVTDWLMQEMPSPAIGKILKKYLPELHQGSSRLEVWNKASTLFNKFQNVVVPERNKLSHVGKQISIENVRIYVLYTRDILYLIDYLEGHDWALEHLSWETRELVGLPMPPVHRQVIEFSIHSGPDI